MRYLALLIAYLAVGSCAMGSATGDSPIILSKNVEEGFEKYKGEQDPRYFAVSLDGRRYGYSACDGPKCRRGGQSIALEKCHSRTPDVMPCKIFAHETKIVWAGPVHFRSSGKPDPETFGDTPYFFGPVYE